MRSKKCEEGNGISQFLLLTSYFSVTIPYYVWYQNLEHEEV